MIKIDKNIPSPPSGRGRKCKYPWVDMKIGDSFFIEGVKGRDFAATAYAAGKRLDMKFSVRTVEGGSRCWKIDNE